MTGTEAVQFDDDNYFGHCAVLEHQNYCLNIGRGHWMVCDKCRIKWFIGANLFSSWRYQNKDIWIANEKKLRKYREIDIRPTSASYGRNEPARSRTHDRDYIVQLVCVGCGSTLGQLEIRHNLAFCFRCRRFLFPETVSA